MANKHRAIPQNGFASDDLGKEPNTLIAVCVHVLSTDQPILAITHEEDGRWQFTCHADHGDADAGQAALTQYGHIPELDPSAVSLELQCLPRGMRADRESSQQPWDIRPAR